MCDLILCCNKLRKLYSSVWDLEKKTIFSYSLNSDIDRSLDNVDLRCLEILSIIS